MDCEPWKMIPNEHNGVAYEEVDDMARDQMESPVSKASIEENHV